jgi:ribonuclease HI
VLRGYCDASFGASTSDTEQRSSYGWIFTLGGAAISWTAKRHSTTSLSIAEAEMMAAKEALTQCVHLLNLLGELNVITPEPVELYIDSQAAFQAIKGEYFSKRLKHVNVALHWTREVVKGLNLEMKLVKSEDQAADFLTKAPTAEVHQTCSRMVGLLPWHTQEQEKDEDTESKTTGGVSKTQD